MTRIGVLRDLTYSGLIDREEGRSGKKAGRFEDTLGENYYSGRSASWIA